MEAGDDMSVNSKMTAIANAARALDGSTGKLTLDGIVSKLGDEKANVAAALAAIAEKGVEVPSGSTSDALAALIAAIEAGGGAKVAYGTFTVAKDYTSSDNIEVIHNLGVAPDFVICSLCNVQYSTKKYEADTRMGRRSGTKSIFGGLVAQKNIAKTNTETGSSTKYSFGAQNTTADNGIDVTLTQYPINNASETSFWLATSTYECFYSGRTYFWLAVGGMV